MYVSGFGKIRKPFGSKRYGNLSDPKDTETFRIQNYPKDTETFRTKIQYTFWMRPIIHPSHHRHSPLHTLTDRRIRLSVSNTDPRRASAGARCGCRDVKHSSVPRSPIRGERARARGVVVGMDDGQTNRIISFLTFVCPSRTPIPHSTAACHHHYHSP